MMVASMSEPSNELAAVVVTGDAGAETLRRALGSLERHAGAVRSSITIVDNSADGLRAAEFEGATVLREPNQGFAAGVNAALPQLDARYVLLMNPDAEVRAGSLEALVEALDRRPGVGVAGVRLVAPDGSLRLSGLRFPSVRTQLGEAFLLPRLRRRLLAGAPAREMVCDWVVGAFMAVRREAIEAAGPLDEGFFLYMEEVDWCLRIRRAGFEVRVLPELTVEHAGSLAVSRAAYLEDCRSRLRYARKHFGPLRRAGFRGALVATYALRAAAMSVPGARAPAGLSRADRRGAELAALRMTLGRA
jgi:GT2 family glycosyltransferase